MSRKRKKKKLEGRKWKAPFWKDRRCKHHSEISSCHVNEFQLELPFSLDDAGGIRKVYLDQAVHGINMPGYQFMAAYTPYGIQCIDSEYIAEIMRFKPGDLERKGRRAVYDDLKRRIMQNVHLHQVIKRNLIYNLELRVKEDSDESNLCPAAISEGESAELVSGRPDATPSGGRDEGSVVETRCAGDSEEN